jgi:hypothetical protein
MKSEDVPQRLALIGTAWLKTLRKTDISDEDLARKILADVLPYYRRQLLESQEEERETEPPVLHVPGSARFRRRG